jgi:hypothetical protein
MLTALIISLIISLLLNVILGWRAYHFYSVIYKVKRTATIKRVSVTTLTLEDSEGHVIDEVFCSYGIGIPEEKVKLRKKWQKKYNVEDGDKDSDE